MKKDGSNDAAAQSDWSVRADATELGLAYCGTSSEKLLLSIRAEYDLIRMKMQGFFF